MRIRIFKTVSIAVLLIAMFMSLLSCSNEPPTVPVLTTNYTKYASGQSMTLDTSSVESFSFVNAYFIGEEVVILSRFSDASRLLFYDRSGNLLSTSAPISIGPEDIVYEIFSPAPDQLCIVSGIEKQNDTHDRFLYGDIYLHTVDRDGNPLEETVVIAMQPIEKVPMVVGSPNGDIYIARETDVTSFRVDGSKLFSNDYERLILLYDIGGIPTVEVDFKYLPVIAGVSDFSGAVPARSSSAAEPAPSMDGLFFYNNAGIFAYDFASMEDVLVFRWNDSDYDYNYSNSRITVLAQDLYLVMQYTSDGGEKLTLLHASLDAPLAETIPGDVNVDGNLKTVITIAGCGIIQEPMSEYSYLMTACRTYEETHPDVDIKVIDYTNEYGYEQGPTQLRLDILSGNAADIFFVTPYDEFDIDEEEAFLDLSSVTASDPEFSTADYYWNIVEDTRVDGGLYSLPLSFTVSVMYGPEKLLAGIDAWTLSDFMALDDTLPEGFTLTAGVQPSQDLAYYMSRTIENYIDPTTREVDLECQAFRNLLEYVSRFALYDEVTMEQIHNKEFVLSSTCISSIQEYTGIFSEAREPQVIIGYPEYEGTLKASIGHTMSISAISDAPDIAWDILKYFLSEDMQTMTLGHFESYVYGVPLNRKAAEWQIDWFDRDLEENTVSEYAPYREEYLAFLDTITTVEHDNGVIYYLVIEESPHYFRGQKSAEDLAKVLENRINLMLAED